MSNSMSRVKSLLYKEMIDLRRNMSILIMCLVPIGNAFMFKVMGIESEMSVILSTTMNMTVAMVGTILMATLIAEEKENNTLRTLMMSGLTSHEFMIGKAFVSFTLVNILNTIIFFILGTSMKLFIIYTLIGLIMSIIMILLGALIGLLVKTQQQVGVVASPIVILLFMLPIISRFNEVISKIAKLFPTYHSGRIMYDMDLGNGIINNFGNIGVLILWIILVGIAFTKVYRFKRFD